MQKTRKTAMLIASTFMLLFLGILYSWSMFRVEFAAEFPDFSASQLSLNFTIVSIGFCLGGFFGGKISGRRSQKQAVRVSAAVILVGFLGCSCMELAGPSGALALLYVFYGAVSGLGVGIGYNACISGTSPWFPEKLGLVSGILLMGFGFGSMFLGLLVPVLSRAVGVYWVLRIYGAVIFLVLMLGSSFLKKPEAPKSAGAEQAEGCTPLQMLARPSFWAYFVWNTISAASGLLVINSSANIALAFGTAAGLGMIVSVFNGCGRPVTGAIMDRMGQFKGMLIMNGVLLLGGALLIAAALGNISAAVFAGMILIGVCYGGGVTISSKVISDLYGAKHYAVNFSLSNFCMIPAAFLGPFVSGLMQNGKSGAAPMDYFSTFMMVAIMALIALADIFVMRLLLKREDKKQK